MRYNYGAFFNVWDRWMGTFKDNGTAHESTAEAVTPFTRDMVEEKK